MSELGEEEHERHRGVLMSGGQTVWIPPAWGPCRSPTRTPRNMSVAILLRLLSLNSMRDSWRGVCKGRSCVMMGEGHI